MLPSALLLQADGRADLHATLQPAREVGGDLYDYFMLDARRLFLLIGDVAGKGLSASIFMAVSKALYKNAMLRTPDADIGAIMRVANAEVSRDNPGSLFVTAFAAILDLDSGELNYCNAGHDNPFRLHAHYDAPLRIAMATGRRCVRWPTTTTRVRAAACARRTAVPDDRRRDRGADDRGQLYGSERLCSKTDGAAAGREATPRALVDTLRADVAGLRRRRRSRPTT